VEGGDVFGGSVDEERRVLPALSNLREHRGVCPAR